VQTEPMPWPGQQALRHQAWQAGPRAANQTETRSRPQRHEGKKEAIVALIASLRCARVVVPRAGRSEPGTYRGTPRGSGEVALSPNSPSDAAPIGRGSLAGPLCNVGPLQKPLWASDAWWYARRKLEGMFGIVVRSWTLSRRTPPGLCVGEAGACTQGRSGVCWPGSQRG
jgi:hypothetical protein